MLAAFARLLGLLARALLLATLLAGLVILLVLLALIALILAFVAHWISFHESAGSIDGTTPRSSALC